MRFNKFTDGIRITHNYDVNPKGLEEHQYYQMVGDENSALLFESVTLDDLIETLQYNHEPVEEMMTEALTLQRKSMERSLGLYMRQLNKAFSTLQAEEVNIGKPRKSAGIATITAQFVLSDGQSISFVFYNPSRKPDVIESKDTLVAFRFVLNSRDITHVVAPVKGREITLRTACKTLAQIAEKNSAKFTERQEANNAKKEELAELEKQADEDETKQADLLDDITTLEAREKAADKELAMYKKLLAQQEKTKADVINIEDAKVEKMARDNEEKGFTQGKEKGVKDIFEEVIANRARKFIAFNAMKGHPVPSAEAGLHALLKMYASEIMSEFMKKLGRGITDDEMGNLRDTDRLYDIFQEQMDAWKEGVSKAERNTPAEPDTRFVNKNKVIEIGDIISTEDGEQAVSVIDYSDKRVYVKSKLGTRLISFRDLKGYGYQAPKDLENDGSPEYLKEMIKREEEFIENDKSLSPIPRDYARKRVSKLYEELAYAEGAGDFEISKDHVNKYRETGSHYEFIETLMEEYGLSSHVARAVADRVELLSSEMREAEYQANPESVLWRKIRATIRDNFTVRHEEDNYLNINAGAGHVTIGRPRISEDQKTFDLSYRYEYDERNLDTDNPNISTHENKTYQLYKEMMLESADSVYREIVSDTNEFASQFETIVDTTMMPKYGAKEEQYTSDLAQVNKLIRADIKEAIKQGSLPRGLKTSVSKSYGSISITVKDVPDNFPLFHDEALDEMRTGTQLGQINANKYHGDRYTPIYSNDYYALSSYLKAIADQYNYNRSDSMTDYFDFGFNLNIYVDSALSERKLIQELDAIEVEEDSEAYIEALEAGAEEIKTEDQPANQWAKFQRLLETEASMETPYDEFVALYLSNEASQDAIKQTGILGDGEKPDFVAGANLLKTVNQLVGQFDDQEESRQAIVKAMSGSYDRILGMARASRPILLISDEIKSMGVNAGVEGDTIKIQSAVEGHYEIREASNATEAWNAIEVNYIPNDERGVTKAFTPTVKAASEDDLPYTNVVRAICDAVIANEDALTPPADDGSHIDDKPQEKLYYYGLRLRAAGPSTVPDGFVDIITEDKERIKELTMDDLDLARHGIVVYKRKLSDLEVVNYELSDLQAGKWDDARARSALTEVFAMATEAGMTQANLDEIWANYFQPSKAKAMKSHPFVIDGKFLAKQFKRALELESVGVQSKNPKRMFEEIAIRLLKTDGENPDTDNAGVEAKGVESFVNESDRSVINQLKEHGFEFSVTDEDGEQTFTVKPASGASKDYDSVNDFVESLDDWLEKVNEQEEKDAEEEPADIPVSQEQPEIIPDSKAIGIPTHKGLARKMTQRATSGSIAKVTKGDLEQGDVIVIEFGDDELFFSMDHNERVEVTCRVDFDPDSDFAGHSQRIVYDTLGEAKEDWKDLLQSTREEYEDMINAAIAEQEPPAGDPYQEYLDKRADLYARSDAADVKMKSFPSGPMGLTPDDVRATPEYKQARKEYDESVKAVQDLNKANPEFVKRLAAEKRKARNESPRSQALLKLHQLKGMEITGKNLAVATQQLEEAMVALDELGVLEEHESSVMPVLMKIQQVSIDEANKAAGIQ